MIAMMCLSYDLDLLTQIHRSYAPTALDRKWLHN
uniref:Uncharacterized protein n=1 Tax=Parascaris equorum TaxID=6256 RepID=A0A914S003_PAREQ